jgi:hypothetical protein
MMTDSKKMVIMAHIGTTFFTISLIETFELSDFDNWYLDLYTDSIESMSILASILPRAERNVIVPCGITNLE